MTGILVPGTLLTLISVVYLFGVAPDMTWIGLAGDSPDYVASAVLFQKAGLGGYPLLIGLGSLFEVVLYKGFGFNMYWVMGLLSAIPTVIASGYIYATVRLFGTRTLEFRIGVINGSITEIMTYSSLPAIVATLAYAGSLLVWSQSVIPEVYSITVMTMVIGTYYVLKAYKEERPRLLYVSAFVFGLSFCTHPLAYFAILPCLIYVIRVPLENKPHLVKLLGIGVLGLIPWVQFFIAGDNVSYAGISSDKFTWLLSSLGYIGNLPILPPDALVTRLEDFLPMIGLGLCILVPSFIFGFKGTYREEKFSVILILTIVLLPLLLYVTSRPPQWITYLLPSIAFLSILGGICAVKFLDKYQVKGSLVVASVCGLGLLGLNLYSYDIGRSIDPSPTTARQMYDKLESLPEGTIVFSHSWGHLGLLIDTHNRFGGSKLIRMDDTSTLKSTKLALEGTDAVLPPRDTRLYQIPLIELEAAVNNYVGQIQELNPNRLVYITYVKDSSKIQFDYISASNYRHSLNDVPQLRQSISR
jgi:hypothetical protein